MKKKMCVKVFYQDVNDICDLDFRLLRSVTQFTICQDVCVMSIESTKNIVTMIVHCILKLSEINMIQ